MTARRAMCALAIVTAGSQLAVAQPLPADPDTAPAPVPTDPAGATPAAPDDVAPAAPEGAAPTPSTDDAAMLAELGLDTEFDDKLHLYGFADFGYLASLRPAQEPASGFVPKEGTFYGASLNVYATRALSPRWRSMLEVRFVYAPAGTIRDDGTYDAATAPDPGEAGRPVQWGGVSIERAHLEYSRDDHLAIQIGTFLTPYGIWNVDHGAPAIIPGMRPWIIGEDLFPERQTGIHVHGKQALGAYTLGYHATLSNGRGPLSAFHDLDENKAIGARVELHAPWFDGVDLGVSAYSGRFTDRPADYISVGADGTPINVTPPGISYDEVAVGVDARLRRGPLLMQAEVISDHADYLDGMRPQARIGYRPDYRYVGAYALAAYRLDALDGLMPYVQAEVDYLPSDPDNGDRGRAANAVIGVNYRPIPDVALKAGFVEVWTHNSPIDLKMRLIDLHAAWVF